MADKANKGFWDKTARLYAPFQERGNRALYDELAAKIGPHIPAGARVLEIACGSGQLTLPLASKAGLWEATDFSEKMVLQTAKRAKKAGCPATVSVQDATALTYPDNSWDMAVAANVLHIMPNPDEALAEMARVLKPGGLLIAACFVYEEDFDPKKMAPLEKIGFKTFYKWTSETFVQYVEAHRFDVEESVVLPGAGLDECLLFCRPRA